MAFVEKIKNVPKKPFVRLTVKALDVVMMGKEI
jgi:hypothetical protein